MARNGWLQGAGAAALTVALVLGVAACGDDSDDGGAAAPTSAATADDAAFCDALVQFNSIVSSSDLGPDTSKDDVVALGQQVAPLFDTIAAEAPSDLQSTAQQLNASAVQPLLQGDASTFGSEESFAAYGQFLGQAVDSCDFPTEKVTAVDYAFQGAPDTVSAGTVAFDLTNQAKDEQHEMVILRKKDETTQSWSELLQLPEDQAESATTYVASAQAAPGQSSSTLAKLTPGSYAMICFLPVGGAEGGQPHFTKGMVHEFTVR
jgi:uncharacterized cupredoxin-like copper-binding protein